MTKDIFGLVIEGKHPEVSSQYEGEAQMSGDWWNLEPNLESEGEDDAVHTNTVFAACLAVRLVAAESLSHW